MLRRLHLDEASRASHLRAPSKEGENQGNQGESDLALEFSRLLDQVQGPIAAAHDEVMALGLALAQAIPLIQKPKQDTQKQDQSDRSQDQAQDNGSREVDVSVGDGQDSGTSTRYSLDTKDTGTAQGPQRREATATKDTSEESEDDEKPQDRQLTVSLNDGPDLVVEDGLVADDSAVTVQAEVVEAAAAPVEAEAAVVVAQLEDSSQGPQVEEGPKEVEIKAVLQDVKMAVSSQQSTDDENDDSADAGQDFTSSSEVMANADDVVIRQVKVSGEKNSAAAADQTEEASAASPAAQSSAAQESGKLDVREVKQALGEGHSVAEQRLQRQREATSKLVQSIKIESTHSLEQAATEPGKTASATVDSAFQMTLLRQAFESLRVQKPEASDTKQRTAAPQSVAAGSITEAKASTHEPTARGSKQLSPPLARRMLERVESTLKEAARSRDGKTLSLRLDPANLGRVKVDVSLREGSLHARITPENKQVLVALRENAPELQAALRKLGLNVDSVTVTVTSEAGQDLSEFGRELNNGKSFQDERNNLPNEGRQVAENTLGNELAEPRAVGSKPAETADSDHWVA